MHEVLCLGLQQSYLTTRKEKKKKKKNYRRERGIINLHVCKKISFVTVVLRWESKRLKNCNNAGKWQINGWVSWAGAGEPGTSWSCSDRLPLGE